MERGYFDKNLVNESENKMSLYYIRYFNTRSEYSSKLTVSISHKYEDMKDLVGVISMLEIIINKK